MRILQNYINGTWHNPLGGAWTDIYEPATGGVYGRLPESDAADIDMAVKAAQQAMGNWWNIGAAGRSEVLLRIAAGIEARMEEFARAESMDQGKPLWLSRSMDIPRAVQNFSFFATEILHFASESHANNDTLNYTLRTPIGVVGCISPWNLPLYLFSWKIAPALAAGCCVVAKPSELTPLTATLLAEICIEANMPPGVLNIVHGSGASAGAPIISHPDIHAISFTGGTKTGADIARVAAPMFKKMSLELGGKNPTIVFADADLAQAIPAAIRAAFTNQGEICLCGSRILVERSIYDRFRDEFVQGVKALKVGDPFDEDTKIGALVSEAHFDKVLSYIDLAIQEGGTVLCGGMAVQPDAERCAKGWFIAPTVIEGLSHLCRTNQEEIFGPVVTLIPFDNEQQAIEMANSTRYGLAANIWTENLRRAHRVAGALESGIVWVNCWLVRDLRTPFGGVKDSGVGREGGFEVLRFFTEPKNICIKY
jgi:aminomuconate-semialdehyde/2-hydroxymuconate-6-semialdehyde dehydrogenase